jgi:WD40 repeat protein
MTPSISTLTAGRSEILAASHEEPSGDGWLVMERYRIFLSSPSDVLAERDRSELVVKRLNAERIDQPQLELIRWELEYYGAKSDFQTQIPKPSECQLVICIFWKQLGSELPEKYVRTDGTIPTGTEYEFEEAMKAAERPEKLPDVLVYRKTAEIKFSVDTLEFERAQYDRFMAFWQRWFRNEKGHFLAGFQSFASPDEFEAVFERNLRAWLHDREVDVTWTHGSPYRGLEPFDVEHAPIFFGRRREVERARARLIASTMGGKPFLLIVGASGAGKSSLARAGLIPRLGQLGGLSTLAAALRWTAVTPGQIAGDWAAGLAARLFEKNALGDELKLGDFNDSRGLATQMARADASACAPLVRALQRAGEKLAAVEGRATPPKVALLILIDQLEELFVWPQERAASFLGLIQELCRLPDSPVLVVATMRSDFQHRIAEFPALEALAGRSEIKGPYEGEQTLEVSLPSSSDLREMILNPSRAAGLTFEVSSARDLAQLIEADARPEAMPSVQFLLSELYTRRRDRMLTLAAFDALGGVDGVMAQRGEDVYRAAEPPARDAFPRLVRALVTQVRSDVPASTRRVPERAFADDKPAGSMVGALRDARLIISDRGELRFTHDSILVGWARLKEQIAEERRLFAARERLEQYCRRWVESSAEPKGSRSKLLLEGFALAGGRELVAKWGAASLTDKQPELPAYIAASDAREKRARRAMQAIGWSIAAVFFVLAAVLFDQWQTAKQAQKETEASLSIARSQSYLRDGKIAWALDQAARAFKSVPSEESRSTLLSSLMEVSPHLAAVASLGSDTAQALAWIDGATLAFASGSRQLRAFAPLKSQGGQDSGSWSLPELKRKQELGRAVVRILQPLGPDRMLAIFDEGSIGLIERGAKAARVQAHAEETSLNPTAHAAAAGSSGSTIVIAAVDEAITLLRCNWALVQTTVPCQPTALREARGRAVAISADERRIAVGGEEGTVAIYDVLGRRIGNLVTIGAPIIALGWAGKRDWLAVGTATGEIAVLDVGSDTRAVIARDKFGDRPISALAWNPQGLGLAFVCNASAVCLWRVNADNAQHPFKPAVRLEGHGNSVTRLSWAPTGRHLASTAADGTIRVWDLVQNTEASFALYSDEPAELGTVATSLDGQWVAAGARDGAIRLWDAKTLAPGRAIKPSAEAEVHSLAWSRNGRLAWLRENDEVDILPAETQQPVLALGAMIGPAIRLAWADEGKTLALPQRDGRVALVDTSKPPGAQPNYLAASGMNDVASGIAVDPKGQILFASHTTGDVHLWDLKTKDPAATTLQNTRADRAKVGVGSLSVSPDGRWLATSGGDRFVTVYDIARRANRLDLTTEANEIQTVAFSPGGRRLAALGSDQRLYVWNFDRDEATRMLAFGAIPSRATIGDASRRGENASWLAWISDDSLAVATASAAITVIRLDEEKWRQRIDGLAEKQLLP